MKYNFPVDNAKHLQKRFLKWEILKFFLKKKNLWNFSLFFHTRADILSTAVFQGIKQPISNFLSVSFEDNLLIFFQNDLAIIKNKKFLPKSSTWS